MKSMRCPNGLDYLHYKDGPAFNSLNFGRFASKKNFNRSS